MIKKQNTISALDKQSSTLRAHLNELVQGGVGGIVGDEEPHVLVGDLHRGRSVHTSHGDNVKKITLLIIIRRKKLKSLPQSKNTDVNAELNSEGMSNTKVQRASRNKQRKKKSSGLLRGWQGFKKKKIKT